MKLQGKTIVITGASKGIGRAVAVAAAQEGANLVLMARSAADLQDLQAAFKAQGVQALVSAGDVANEHDARACVQLALDVFGQVDVLVNNAGTGVFKPVEELSVAEWDTMMEVNVRGTFLMTKAVVPGMKARRSGRIVNIASDVSKRTFPTGSAYCASKYAQHGFADAVRKELLDFGVQVSTVYPGMVDTYFGGATPDPDRKPTHLHARDIAEAVMYVLQAPDYMVIDEVVLHPMRQRWWS